MKQSELEELIRKIVTDQLKNLQVTLSIGNEKKTVSESIEHKNIQSQINKTTKNKPVVDLKRKFLSHQEPLSITKSPTLNKILTEVAGNMSSDDITQFGGEAEPDSIIEAAKDIDSPVTDFLNKDYGKLMDLVVAKEKS